MASNQEKRKSEVDLGLPWRQPGVDPTRADFDAASRAGAAGMYAFGNEPGFPGDPEGEVRQCKTMRLGIGIGI